MGADGDAKLTSLWTQAVGLLVVLADSANVMVHAFGKQELWRHILDSHAPLPPNSVLRAARAESSVQTMDMERQASGGSSSHDSKGRVKKVRFAPDVVEHRGSSQIYHQKKNKGNVMAKKTMPAAKKEHKEVWHDTHVNLEVSLSKPSPVNARCTAQALGKPYLPANRMLLYKGKQLSRAMMARDL